MEKVTRIGCKCVFIVVLLLLLLNRLAGPVEKAARYNAANISLVKVFASTTSDKRRLLLAEYVSRMERILGQEKTSPLTPLSSIDMIQSIYIGQYYRLIEDEGRAVKWFENALEIEVEKPESVPEITTGANALLPDGNISIENFEHLGSWKLDKTPDTELLVEIVSGIANIEYLDTKLSRDLVTYTYMLGTRTVELSSHRDLLVRMKGFPGAFLTIEVIIDGERARILPYYTGEGIWETLRFPLQGHRLEGIVLSFSEPIKADETTTRRIQLDWIRMGYSSAPTIN